MIKDLMKWVAPGLATVLGGTALVVLMTSSNIAADIETRANDALQSDGFVWAELSFDTRDALLRGTTTDQSSLDAAMTRLSQLHGVRSVNSDVQLAPKTSPYPFSATVADGAIALTGGVPDAAIRDRLMARAGTETHSLELLSGMPPRQTWLAGVEFAIDQLKLLDQGEATVSDLNVTLEGRAKSDRAFRDLMIILRAGPPAGVTLAASHIAPALVAPYEWSATSDGKTISITGFIPDDSFAERYRTADVSGLPVATGLALGSGEPAGFADKTLLLLRNLARLEHGTATLTDGESRLTGAPATLEIAQAVTNDLQGAGSIVVLDGPRIADYWITASRQPGGTVVFDGYVPDDVTRQSLSKAAGADTSYLKLGRGAPERYHSGVEFGLAALDRLSEGRFALRSNVLTIEGIARSTADYAVLSQLLAAGAPQGIVLARGEIVAPQASPYLWSAVKSPDGAVTLSGMVPNADAASQLASVVSNASIAGLSYASGAPSAFLDSAATGLSLLDWLQTGEVKFDGTAWTVTGTAPSTADKTAMESDFAARQLASAGWSLAVDAAPEVAVAMTPLPDVPAPTPPVAAPTQSVAAPETPAIAAEPEAPITVEPTPALVAPEAPATASEPASAPAPSVVAPETPAEVPPVALQPQLAPVEPAAPAPEQPVAAAPVAPAIAAAPAPLATPAPSAGEACRTNIAAFSARNSILFQSGAAIIAADSEPALDELATYLAACPEAAINIEGHTDASGDPQLNLALSVARAEAVVNALIARDIAPSRLYAVGYGASSPIADNETAQGKQLNRRIVVSILEP